MFGIYLHAITQHAPQQLEIVNLKSTNTEHEERLFGQAKDMVHKATNRKPQNVIPNILLRLQAKQKRGDMYISYHSALSRVSKAVSELKHDGANTTITHSFLTGRMSSWQENLKRISPFLRRGEGVWWKSTEEGYEFHDGREEPDFRPEGPELLHFRDVHLNEIYTMNKLTGKKYYVKKTLPSQHHTSKSILLVVSTLVGKHLVVYMHLLLNWLKVKTYLYRLVNPLWKRMTPLHKKIMVMNGLRWMFSLMTISVTMN